MGSKIYTGTGDKGSTSLLSGNRVSKDDPRVEAYGCLDELQSQLGISRVLVKSVEFAGVILDIQHEIFIASAELSWDGSKEKLNNRLTINSVEKLEKLIDQYTARCAIPSKFVVPGATHESAVLHVARAVCRRGERIIVKLSREHEDFEIVLVYFNRLSDLLFVIARNLEVEAEVTEAVLQAIASEEK